VTNILRRPNEKNNSNFNDRWLSLFNALIDAFKLRELELSGRHFTWANNLQTPTFPKQDRILIRTEWGFVFHALKYKH
jgi:hypothetical protein